MKLRRSFYYLFLLTICLFSNGLIAQNSSDTGPSWGDGEVIGFSSKRTGNYDIYIKHLGSNQVMAIVTDSLDQHYPVWSPDGSKFAFQSDIGNNKEIFLMDVYARTKRNITNHKAADGDDYVCWSKDGKHLYFTSDRNGSRNIHKLEISSGEVTSIFDSSSSNINPSLSPDGKQMAYSTNRNGNFDIYVMDLESKEERQITSNESNEMFPSWFPEGNRLLFQRRSEFRQSDFFGVDLDSKEEKNLTNMEGLKFYPKLSADGKQILYMSGNEKGTFLYTFNLGSGDVKQLTGN